MMEKTVMLETTLKKKTKKEAKKQPHKNSIENLEANAMGRNWVLASLFLKLAIMIYICYNNNTYG